MNPTTCAPRPRPRLSRTFRAAALILAAFTPVAAITVSSAERSSANGHHQLMFGAYVRPDSGQTRQAAVQTLESQLGRTLGVSREFLLWDEAFPTAYHNWLRDGGRTLILSAKAKRLNGTSVSWNSIANATPGSALYNEIVSWVDRLGAFGAPVYFALSHEPEAATNLSLGTDANFIAAWRKVVGIARDRAVTNVKFIWIMTDYAFTLPPTERRFADKWYPGDSWVDAAGIDPYNWHVCRPTTPNSWRPLADLVEPFRLWSLNHPNLELWLTEFASVEDPTNANRKANWINDAQLLFGTPAYSRFVGVSYYHGKHPTGEYPLCTWWMNTTANALTASVTLANDPLFGATVPPTTTTTTTTSTTTSTTTTTVAPPGAAAIVVVGDGANPAAGDLTIANRLTGRGYITTIVDDGAVTAGASADVILISSSIDSNVLGTTLKTTPAAVISYKPYSWPKFAMTTDTGVGSFSIASTGLVLAHPIAAGRSGTVTLTAPAKSVGWGIPSGAADVIATTNTKATTFAYDVGDVLSDATIASGCRVALPLRHDALTSTTADLWSIFDATVDWATAC